MNTINTLSTFKKSALVGAVAAALIAPAATSLAQQTTNAQSAMLAVELDGSFAILGEETWVFVKEDAAALYENVFDDATTPVYLGCTPTSRCGGATPPSAFPAPAADKEDHTNQLAAQVQQDKCTMFDGGFLGTRTYTYDATKRVGSPPNHRDFKFRYTYVVRPDASNPAVNPAGRVGDRTAWFLQSASTENPMATLGGFVAGQSTSLQKASKNKPETFKVSHSILDNQGNPRVENLQAILTRPGALESQVIDLQVATVETGADFIYQRTLGSANGPTSQLIDGHFVSHIQQGVTPLGFAVLSPGNNQDNFAGNDLTGGERVIIMEEVLELDEPGEWGLVVSGAVKGVQGSSDLGFSVTRIINVGAEGCI